MKRSIDVHERLPFFQMIPLGIQHLFAMFGATILVPILTELSPAVALFTSGTGTLIFILITQGKVPAYLGSSFAFITPITAVAAQYGLPAALAGGVVIGLIYCIVAAFIALVGVGWLDRLLPPVVIGSVIIVIGMGLAPVAVEMAGLSGESVSLANVTVQISLVTLAVTVLGSIFFKGFFAVIPVLIGIVVGYVFAAFRGAIDFSVVREAAWLGKPNFMAPEFNWSAIAMMAPVAFVVIAEHLGDVLVLSKITGRDFYKNPGLSRTLLGDGLASAWASLWGGPPNTTYGENVGVMAMTKVYSVWVVGLAAIFAIILAFIPKAEALISTIPAPVMGGVSMVLFGIIASSGLRTLVESGVDYANKRNLVISSVILTLGLGEAAISAGSITIQGMALATLAGIVLNLILPMDKSEEAKASE
ncbi:MAG: uracil permease [Firmicutes bacterium]|nr:uracil permease [Bacillota bacterium]